MRKSQPVEVDDPLALEPGDKIVALRSIRNDPLAACIRIARSTRRNIRAAGPSRTIGRRPSAVRARSIPTREYVDGGERREPITEGQRRAVLRLNRAERELGADGSALVHEVLILGMTMEQVGAAARLRGQRWKDYFARRFQECLDRLALIYGFASPHLSRSKPSGAEAKGCTTS